jgi:hypothetical protein
MAREKCGMGMDLSRDKHILMRIIYIIVYMYI